MSGYFSGGSGASIGGLVTGGTQGSVLFVGAGGVLAQDNDRFAYDDTNNQLQLSAGAVGNTPLKITLFAAQTADAFQVFASDGTTKLFSVGADGSAISANELRSSGFQITASALRSLTYGTNLTMPNDGRANITKNDNNITCLLGGGASVASAAALPLPTGRIFHVTGTTGITSITSTNFQSGAIITLIFDGALTVTDGSNLKLAGNFTTTADDTLTLGYDGTNWFEICRSVN